MSIRITSEGDYTNVNTINGITVPTEGDEFVVEESGDVKASSLNDGGQFGFRNMFINGGMEVWSRVAPNPNANYEIRYVGDLPRVDGGVGNASVKRYYGPDRFAVGMDSTRGSDATLRRIPTTIAGCPLPYQMRISGLTNSSSTGLRVIQAIEIGKGVAGPFQIGTKWTFSVYSSRNLTGTSVEVRFADDSSHTNSGNNMGGTLVRDGSSNRYYYTVTIDENAGSTNTCLVVSLKAPDYTPNNNWDLTGFQLEPGDRLTPYEQRPVALEKSMCARYCVVRGAWSGGPTVNGLWEPLADGLLLQGNKLSGNDGFRMGIVLSPNFRSEGLEANSGYLVNNGNLSNTNSIGAFNPNVILTGLARISTVTNAGTGESEVDPWGTSGSVAGKSWGNISFSNTGQITLFLWMGTNTTAGYGYGQLMVRDDAPNTNSATLLIIENEL